MDTSWFKIAAIIVVAVAVVIGVKKVIRSIEQKPKEPTTTIYDMAEKDKERLLAAPSAKDFEQSEANEAAGAQQQAAPAVAEQAKPAEPVVLYFTPVPEEEALEAENIMGTVPSWRTIGRLPFTGYNALVQACRQLMSRWPGSKYDYMGRRALSQVPQRYWARYKITAEEVDLDYFKKQRPNTEPYKITEDN